MITISDSIFAIDFAALICNSCCLSVDKVRISSRSEIPSFCASSNIIVPKVRLSTLTSFVSRIDNTSFTTVDFPTPAMPTMTTRLVFDM